MERLKFRGQIAMQRQFTDTFQIGTLTGAGWGSAQTTPTWTYDAINAFHGFVKQVTASEVADGSEATITDATLYIPHGTSLTSAQRIKCTHRDRKQLGAEEIYLIIGIPQQDRTCLVCTAQLLVGDSAR